MLAGLVGSLFAVSCAPPEKAPDTPVTVFAAASLTDALGEIAEAYERSSGHPVRLSFASSGTVARQIQSGAPADAVILADEVWMDRLESANALAPGSRADLLRNHLVVIAPASAETGGKPFDWLARTNGKLVIGDPESVPAGAYARTWLRHTNRWDRLQSRLVMAADVRAVRTFVEREEAGLGVVYRSDTIGAPGVSIVAEPTAADQPAILYPVAATRQGAARATAFLVFLRGTEARRIFAARGFEPLA